MLLLLFAAVDCSFSLVPFQPQAGQRYKPHKRIVQDMKELQINVALFLDSLV